VGIDAGHLNEEFAPLAAQLLQRWQQAEQECAVLKQSIDSTNAEVSTVKREKMRAVQDNNQLHMELVRAKELQNELQDELSAENERAKLRLLDANFITSQNTQKIKEMELQNEALRQRLQQTLARDGKSKDDLPAYARQGVIQMASTADAWSTAVETNSPPIVPSEAADLQTVSDMKIEELHTELRIATTQLEVVQKQLARAQENVIHREQEIERLGHLVSRQDDGQSKSRLEHLEAQLRTAKAHQEEFASENRAKENELAQSASTIESLQREVQEVQSLLRDNQMATSKLEADLRLALTRGASEQDANAQLSPLNQRCAKLELQCLQLQTERDEYKKQTVSLRDAVEKAQHPASPTSLTKPEEVLHSDGPVESPLQSQAASSPTKLPDADPRVQQLENENRVLRHEIEHLQSRSLDLQNQVRSLYEHYGELEAECTQLRHFCREQRATKTETPVDNDQLQTTLNAAQEECAMLRSTMQEYDIQLLQIQSSVRSGSRQRDELSAALAQATSDLDKCREQLVESERRYEDAASQSQNLAQCRQVLEEQNRGAEDSLDKFSAELSTAKAAAERFQREHRLACTEIRKLEGMKQAFEVQVETMQSESKVAETERAELASKAGHLEAEVVRLRTSEQNTRLEVEQLQSLIAEMDRTRSDLTDRLRETALRSEREAATAAGHHQAKEQSAKEVLVWKTKADTLTVSLTCLDRERDMLQIELDKSAAELDQLRNQCEVYATSAENADGRMAEVIREADGLAEALANKEHEIAVMQRNISESQQVNERVMGDLAASQEQLNQQEQDIIMMTKETQLVNAELLNAVQSNEVANQGLNDTRAELTQLRKVHQVARQEHEDLLMSYRKLNDEMEYLQKALQCEETKCDQAALEAAQWNKRLEMQAEDIHNKDEEIRDLNIALRTLGINTDELARDVGLAQTKLEDSYDSCSELQQQLEHARRAYMASEEHRNKLQHELVAALEANSNLTAQAKNFELEIEVSAQQLQLEAKRCNELESLLCSTRMQLHSREEPVTIPAEGEERYLPKVVSYQEYHRPGQNMLSTVKPTRGALQRLELKNGHLKGDGDAARPLRVSGTLVQDLEEEVQEIQKERQCTGLSCSQVPLCGSSADKQLCNELQALERIYDRAVALSN